MSDRRRPQLCSTAQAISQLLSCSQTLTLLVSPHLLTALDRTKPRLCSITTLLARCQPAGILAAATQAPWPPPRVGQHNSGPRAPQHAAHTSSQSQQHSLSLSVSFSITLPHVPQWNTRLLTRSHAPLVLSPLCNLLAHSANKTVRSSKHLSSPQRTQVVKPKSLPSPG